MNVRDRILARVTYVDQGYTSECWVSDRARNSGGYTYIKTNGVQQATHQAAYEAWVGPIPEGLSLDHLCHDGASCDAGSACLHRQCCNPEHLEPVTHTENTRRGRHALKDRCSAGHLFDVANTRNDSRGKRACRKCAVIATQKWRRRRAQPFGSTG